MPCYQSANLPSGVTTTGRTSYRTEAECNQACKEGACCEGTSCTVKPQCQCQGTFFGLGSVCSSGICCDQFKSDCAGTQLPATISVSFQITNNPGGDEWLPSLGGEWSLSLVSVGPQSGAQYQCASYGFSRPASGANRSVLVAVEFFFTQSSGQWVRAVSVRAYESTLNSFFGAFAFPSGGPCVSGGYIPVSGCLAASAGLHQRTASHGFATVPCSQWWATAGTVSVSA